MWLAVSIVGLFAFFYFMQRQSDKTYRPSAEDIKNIINASIEGRLSLAAFDEFSCVRIAYDKRLDNIRERYKHIVENREYIEGEFTKDNSTPLNAQGKEELRKLIRELEIIAAQ